jgi:hypothetical protein
MKITLYFIGWNDKFYLPFIKQHYGKFCQRIVYYDNYSNDGSQELARELGFEVRNFGYSNRLDDQDYLNVKNHCWKEERENGQQADYVIVCDADEFICIDDLRGTAPKVVGFNLISDRLPTNKITDINTGSFSINYSKQAIFSPCRLLHFRQIGGVDRLIERHAQYRERMSKFNLKHGMGSHYLHSDDQKRIEWAELQSKAVELW